MVDNKIPLIIHAGRHKTGTSYLQQFLGINRQTLLQKYSILYPASGKNPYFHYHHDLMKCLGDSGNKSESLLTSFQKEVFEKKPKAIILSSEYLSRSSINENFLRNIKSALSNYDITVIFYLRNQGDFLCSRYAEQTKQGILSYPDNIWTINAELDYIKFLERYANVFGTEQVQVHFYDSAKNNGGLLNDFVAWIGVQDISGLTVPERGSNKRLPWNYLKLLWYANNKKIGRQIVLNRFIQKFFIKGASVFPKLFDGKRPITEAESTVLGENFNASNTLVYKRFSNQSDRPILASLNDET